MARWSALVLAAVSVAAGCEGNLNDDDLPLAFTSRSSVNSLGFQANGDSGAASVSADAGRIAFRSTSSNLVPGDLNGFADIFYHEPATRITQLVSMGGVVIVVPIPAGVYGFTLIEQPIQADADSFEPEISGNGASIVYSSLASNITPFTPAATTTIRNVYLSHLDGRRNERVSLGLAAADTDGDSVRPSISYDASKVAYESVATNLTVEGTGGTSQVYLWTAAVGNKLISVDALGGPGNGASRNARIAAGGGWIAFESDATDLRPLEDLDPITDIYVADLSTGALALASTSATGVKANAPCVDPSISADGRYVAFSSAASNLVPGDLNSASDIFVKDLVTGEVRRVSVTSDGVESDGNSIRPHLSSDGSMVVFESRASNLILFDLNGMDDAFAHELATAKTYRVSVRTFGEEATGGASIEPRLSGDGRFVVLNSDAVNLVDADTNSMRDVFIRGPLR